MSALITHYFRRKRSLSPDVCSDGSSAKRLCQEETDCVASTRDILTQPTVSASLSHQPETVSDPHEEQHSVTNQLDPVTNQPDSVTQQTERVSAPLHVKDVGKCLTGKTNLWTLTAPEKLNIIDNHFRPDEDYAFPKTDMNKCKRGFRHQWLSTYPWLIYSQEVDGGFCLPCVLFATKGNLGVLVNTPFRRWTKVSDVCGQHQQKNYHSDAQLTYDQFVTNQREPEKNIESQISIQRQELIKQNREVIKSVSKCVEVCGKMGLALRGHRDDSTADPNSNKGIFQTLIDFRQEAGDTVLKTHFETCGKNATYTSKTVQNELINIMGEQIRDDIIDEIKKARFYSILCDEVTDCSNTEQLTIVLRFVDELANIREEFVQFCSTERITGEVIANTILSNLNNWGLDIEDCRGQGYDGASNMSSARVGVQGRLCGLNPLALYTHCCSHILNLVIVKACTIPVIRNMAGTITETSYFFQNSAKRQRMFEKVIDRSETDTEKKKLHDLCRTRWVERHEAYENFFSLYECIVNTMDVILNESQHEAEYGSWSWDRETLTKANGLIHALTNFEFIVALVVTLKCLSVLKPVSVKLQKKSNDTMTAYRLVRETQLELEEYRYAGEDTFTDWFDVCKTLGDKVDVHPSIPRTAGRQTQRSNTPHDGPEEYYRRTVFLPFLDHLTTEMNDRFGPLQEKASLLLGLVPASLNYETSIGDIADLYVNDLPSPSSLDVEYTRWQRKWESIDEKPDSLQKALQACDSDVFPNISILLRIACTLPITSVETERANSVLKRLKTYLRSTMSNERLTGLALMKIHFHHEMDFDKVAAQFATRQPRRMIMSNPLKDC